MQGSRGHLFSQLMRPEPNQTIAVYLLDLLQKDRRDDTGATLSVHSGFGTRLGR